METKTSVYMALLFLKKNIRNQSAGFSGKTNNEGYRPPINFLPFFLFLALIAIVGKLIFGYEKNAVTIEEIEESLSPEVLKAYQAAQDKVDEKFEDCIQYILYALEDGQYVCASCPPGIPFVTLKKGEIWYIGHTCQEGEDRHSQAFQKRHGVWMFTNFVGNKESCHKVELKLLRGYQYLPESLKPEVKLILPPYNRTDKN